MGVNALGSNTNGSANGAVGESARVVSGFPTTTGSNNTFLGDHAGQSVATEVDNATAIGAAAVVNESNAMVLSTGTTNVGITNSAPVSSLQVGSPGNGFGAYLQIPAIHKSVKPPASDCNNSTLQGRIVIGVGTSSFTHTTLWICGNGGKWVKTS